jgi:hypothetical protein
LKQVSASLPFNKARNARCFGFWDAVVFVQITKSPGFHIASGAPQPRQIPRQSPLKIPAKGFGEQFPQYRSIAAMQKHGSIYQTPALRSCRGLARCAIASERETICHSLKQAVLKNLPGAI